MTAAAPNSVPVEGGARRLIVNADDLGQSFAVNRGIADTVDAGVVTSASLMVRWPAAEDAARWARRHPNVSVGLHVDLCEWTVVDGEWQERYVVVDRADLDAVADEIDRQVGRFVRLMGRLPTHLDSHQHVHRDGHVAALVGSLGDRLGVTVRGAGDVGYCGDFYGQYGAGLPFPEGITVDTFIGVLDRLPAGTTEVACHPAAGDLVDLVSLYREERLAERDVLCDTRIPRAIAARGITLVAH
jgi:predicted glycoside hydrolase/deacetylase ChbG (UPF0249 family)